MAAVFGFLKHPPVHFYFSVTTPESLFLSHTEAHKEKQDVVSEDNLSNEQEVVTGLNMFRQSQLRLIMSGRNG